MLARLEPKHVGEAHDTVTSVLTVIHPLADTYLNKKSLTAGDKAEVAAKQFVK